MRRRNLVEIKDDDFDEGICQYCGNLTPMCKRNVVDVCVVAWKRIIRGAVDIAVQKIAQGLMLTIKIKGETENARRRRRWKERRERRANR